MAYLKGVTPGFIPVVEEETPRPPAPTRQAEIGLLTCIGCGGDMLPRTVNRKAAKGMEMVAYTDSQGSICKHCGAFFGLPGMDGVTRSGPKWALALIGRTREAKWVMVTKPNTFYSYASGQEFTVEMGDMFQASRIGLDPALVSKVPSKEQTWKMFTIEIPVGKNSLTLFPHEFGEISWLRIMELRHAGEVIEQFLEADDQNGYFAPIPELREKIQDVFGAFWDRCLPEVEEVGENIIPESLAQKKAVKKKAKRAKTSRN